MGTLDSAVMCLMCRAIEPSKTNTVRHIHLRILAKDDPDGKLGFQSLYQCSVCQTSWLHQFDKWQCCQGFKLWPGSADDYFQTINSSPAKKTLPAEKTQTSPRAGIRPEN